MTVLQIFIWLPIFPTLSEDLDHVMCKCTSVVVYHQSLPVDVKQIPHIQPASLPVFLFAISAQLFVAFLQGLKKNHQVAKLCGYLMAMSNLQDSLRSYLYSYMEQGPVRFIDS